MEIKYNVTGDERKALVAAIGESAQIKPKYLGAPSFAYEVGHIRIDKNGTVSFDDCIESEEVKRIVDGLKAQGFRCEAPDCLTIEIPREGVSDIAISNLRRLIAGKAALIKKALDAESLDIEVSDDNISFPWFSRIPDPEEINAYVLFIEKLVGMAKTHQRVNAVSTGEIYSEKYCFRCFLLRLGFIGTEYKATRKTLLKKLSGSSAYSRTGVAENE